MQHGWTPKFQLSGGPTVHSQYCDTMFTRHMKKMVTNWIALASTIADGHVNLFFLLRQSETGKYFSDTVKQLYYRVSQKKVTL